MQIEYRVIAVINYFTCILAVFRIRAYVCDTYRCAVMFGH